MHGFERIKVCDNTVDAWLWRKGMSDINEEIQEKAELVEQFRQIILIGPPGTSKTWFAQSLAVGLIDPMFVEYNDRGKFDAKLKSELGSKKLGIVQFHPSYNYEDFVRGIQVRTTSRDNPRIYETVDRIFAAMAKKAQVSKDKGLEDKYVLIIDEINRANLSAVLGELIYALEYRGDSIILPYAVGDDDYTLSVPPNLYITRLLYFAIFGVNMIFLGPNLSSG